ncbi:formin-binding protein [Diplodia seriata]|uniref:Formin-binding protein n=1 Tax=Diplodia seriata TaxID=420778 RepID=A0ABR3CW35_9PEZI
MPGTTVSDPPSVSLSFANNFWGKDDAGVTPLLERMHSAKVTGDELKSFYTARAHIEEEYARKLLNLSRKPLGSSESGTLKMSLDVVRAEIELMGKQHQQIAGQMKSELEEQLSAFTGGLKERRKIVQTGIEKLLKVKMQQTSAVNKARDRYEQDCLKIKGYLAQGHMVMGHEERKNKAKLEKTQVQLSGSSQEYEQAVKILEETTSRWNREWKKACDNFQDFEEERLDFMKSSLWAFANIASTVCVSDDASLEKIRLSLEDCEVEKDITNFIRDCGTGQEIPDPPKFIDFCRGDAADDASMTSEDNNYTVAQFARTMNPAFRTQAMQEQYQSQYGEIPQIPHNAYPADGMTQFCRIARSERVSASPEPDADPVDPRANFQLNVGKNVFDVASPDKRNDSANPAAEEQDPIAAALAELKAPSKQTSIPEELSFNKGDVLAITREQDDGWWEAEVLSKAGRLGLVPSNYLQNC